MTGFLCKPSHGLRFEGYLKGLRSKRIGIDMQMVKETSGLKPEEDFQAIEELLSLNNPPTAIVAGNDSRALNILEYCGKNGIKVPEELSVLGFDNVPDGANSKPPLTTMDTQNKRLGKESVYLILDLINGKLRSEQNVFITPHLVLRKSTAPPGK